MTRDEMAAAIERNRRFHADAASAWDAASDSEIHAAISEAWRRAGEMLRTLEPAPLVWTRDRPTTGGVFWARFPGESPRIWYMNEYLLQQIRSGFYGDGQWAGPIPEPTEPEGGNP